VRRQRHRDIVRSPGSSGSFDSNELQRDNRIDRPLRICFLRSVDVGAARPQSQKPSSQPNLFGKGKTKDGEQSDRPKLFVVISQRSLPTSSLSLRPPRGFSNNRACLQPVCPLTLLRLTSSRPCRRLQTYVYFSRGLVCKSTRFYLQRPYALRSSRVNPHAFLNLLSLSLSLN